MSSNPFDAVSGVGFGAFGPAPAADPNQPAWVTSFQDTMKEINEKGFGAYAKDINDQKLAEMRKKILGKMGLSEDDLSKMTPEGRAAIEKMISEEIRQRLAAEAEMRAKGKKDDAKDGQTTDPVTGQSSSMNPADKAASVALEAAAPNGFGAGMTLIRAMESQDAAYGSNQAANQNERDPETRQ